MVNHCSPVRFRISCRISDFDHPQFYGCDPTVVHWFSKPAIIKDDEIRAIREFTRIHNNIDISKSFVDSQEDCMVTTVPFMQGDKHSIALRKAIIKVFLPPSDSR